MQDEAREVKEQKPRRRRSRRRTRAPEAAAEPAEGALAGEVRGAEPQVGAAEARPPTETVAPRPDLWNLFSEQNSLLRSSLSRQLAAMRGLQEQIQGLRAELAQPQFWREAAGALERKPRLGVFLDVPNIFYAAERAGIDLDYGRMLAYLCRGRELVRACAYAPIIEDNREPIPFDEQKFVQPVLRQGYKIVTKPLKRFADGTLKANFDVELAIDVLTMSERLDVVCLVSGDGDFSRLVQLIESKGVRVEVAAFAGSVSAELKVVADEYTELADCWRDFARQH